MDTLQLNKSKNGYTYILLLCEEFSGYIIASPLKTLSASEAVKVLRVIFSHLPIPQSIRSDNATQFSNTQMRQFMTSIDVEHVFSTPLQPQSNGHAENSVKQIKRVLHQAILHYGSQDKANWDILSP